MDMIIKQLNQSKKFFSKLLIAFIKEKTFGQKILHHAVLVQIDKEVKGEFFIETFKNRHLLLLPMITKHYTSESGYVNFFEKTDQPSCEKSIAW